MSCREHHLLIAIAAIVTKDFRPQFPKQTRYVVGTFGQNAPRSSVVSPAETVTIAV
jgi:hypothetical protein